MKTTTIRLYSLDYSNVKTYFAALFSFWVIWFCHNFVILFHRVALLCYRFISLRLLLLINTVGKSDC